MCCSPSKRGRQQWFCFKMKKSINSSPGRKPPYFIYGGKTASAPAWKGIIRMFSDPHTHSAKCSWTHRFISGTCSGRQGLELLSQKPASFGCLKEWDMVIGISWPSVYTSIWVCRKVSFCFCVCVCVCVCLFLIFSFVFVFGYHLNHLAGDKSPSWLTNLSGFYWNMSSLKVFVTYFGQGLNTEYTSCPPVVKNRTCTETHKCFTEVTFEVTIMSFLRFCSIPFICLPPSLELYV